MISLVLLVAAFICFALAAAGVSTRINLLSTGLALWVLEVILAAHPI